MSKVGILDSGDFNPCTLSKLELPKREQISEEGEKKFRYDDKKLSVVIYDYDEMEILSDYIGMDIKTYLEYSSWNTGRIKKDIKGNYIYVNKDNIVKYINKLELNIYLEDGWIKGNLCKSTKGKVRVYKNNRNTTIDENLLDEYITNGWKKGAYKVRCDDCNKELSSLGKQNHKCLGKEHKYIFNLS